MSEQLRSAFSLPTAPMWMDSSTQKQCESLNASVGGPQRVADISGSRAYERFSGSQIAKLISEQPDVYNRTERISVISSALASLLLGQYAPIDSSDGSGMNLLDISQLHLIGRGVQSVGNENSNKDGGRGDDQYSWSDELIRAVSESDGKGDPKKKVETLRRKLGRVVASHSIIGRISPYLCARYGFSESCRIAAFTGDNPSSLVGLLLQAKGDVGVSLGTSDTLFGIIDRARPSGEKGHIFANPIDPISYMGMLCFKNGSLTRERVRNDTVGRSWTLFDHMLEATPAGNNGNVGVYFVEPEITPTYNGTGIWRFNEKNEYVKQFEKATEMRALVEGHFLALRFHSESLGLSTPRRIVATGGGSKNTSLLQILSDTFNARVFTVSEGSESAVRGSAYRAAHAHLCAEHNTFVPFGLHIFADTRATITQSKSGTFLVDTQRGVDDGPDDVPSSSPHLICRASPVEENVAVMQALLERYAELEKRVVRGEVRT